MPLDQFDDRDASHQRDHDFGGRQHSQIASALRALLGDVAYFWWAFAGLGGVMLVAAVC